VCGSIPCCIRDVQIERALCDLGASVSLAPLSLCWKLKLLDLTPITISIKLADWSTRQPVGILEDVLVRVSEFVIPCDFFIMDMDESSHVPIILGRPFMATTEAEIDVKVGTISFWMCGERVDFYFPPPTPSPAPVTSPPPAAPMPTIPPNAVSRTEVFDADGGLYIWPIVYDAPLPIPTSFGNTSICPGEVVDPTAPFYTSTCAPPMSSPFTIWR